MMELSNEDIKTAVKHSPYVQESAGKHEHEKLKTLKKYKCNL
jgi:hypothetical protein